MTSLKSPRFSAEKLETRHLVSYEREGFFNSLLTVLHGEYPWSFAQKGAHALSFSDVSMPVPLRS
ncbi:MAG: hypothetical protein JWM68_47 [Verrucomicrobiales bacterium]|nr:hypothetical protein [Verrucomicrobiales bacterium]